MYVVAFFLAITVNFILPRLMPGSVLSTLYAELSGASSGLSASTAVEESLGFSRTSAPLRRNSASPLNLSLFNTGSIYSVYSQDI